MTLVFKRFVVMLAFFVGFVAFWGPWFCHSSLAGDVISALVLGGNAALLVAYGPPIWRDFLGWVRSED